MPTIGVSIPVPDPWGRRLQDYRISMGDEVARGIPTHITLLPPQQVADDRMEGVVGHLGEVAGRTAPFRVHLRGTGTFRPVSPVVFIGVVEGISACEQLAHAVRRGPLPVETSFPYHPHVTIAQGVSEERLEQAFTELEGFEAVFEVTEMWMYLHDEVSGWQPSRSFDLGG